MDAYVTLLPPFMPDEHRAYIDLPSPEEIEARLTSFHPASDVCYNGSYDVTKP